MSAEPADKEKPFVSVVVPTYQHALYIEECVQSILAQQTGFAVEILIGEDESTDGTREICQRLAATHPDRIRLFLRSRKDVIHIMGKPTGRANLLGLFKEARGAYIAWCDGDDHWTDPLKLQKQVDFLEAHPQYALCTHRAYLQKGDALEVHKIPDNVDPDNVLFEDLLANNFITTASIVFRNDKVPLPDYFAKLPFLDLGLSGHLSRKGRIKSLDDLMSAYRIHSAGIWTSRSRAAQLKGWLVFYAIVDRFLTPAQRAIVKAKRKDALAHIAEDRFPGRPAWASIYRRALAWQLALQGHVS